MMDEALVEKLNRGYVCPPDAGPAWREASEYGIDMSLVEDALSRTPEERLEQHQRVLNQLLMLKEGAAEDFHHQALVLRLKQHAVKFVVVGGVCGFLHGASLVTLDLDVCCPFSIENLKRINRAISDLHPYHRLTPEKLPFELTGDLASRLKNLYLQTDLGPLDCLSEIAGIGNYNAVFERSVPYKSAHGELRILSLEALIAAKKTIGRDRDLMTIKLLRAIKEKKEGRKT
ncbi:MAG TPA: hypothetical protein VN578_08900 [Candidatus Binatia bacterium]|jgi:hypothetical protein|nr:hypothetical protein [Candidatus Binatia bacterium]